MTELQKIVAVEETIVIQGEELTIRSFKFGQFLKIKPAFNKIILALANVFVMAETHEEIKANILTLETEIYEAFSGLEEEVLQLMSIASGKSIEWIENIEDPIEGSTLLTTILAVNASFFRQKAKLKN